MISVDDLNKKGQSEISDEELEGVAGGFVNWIATMTDDVHN